MPEMTVTVRWPDGVLEECYSPSLVMHDHLRAGEAYPVAEFVRRTGTALDEASRRVQASYGFACTSAAAQKQRIEDRAQHFVRPPADTSAAGMVQVVAMEPQLPIESEPAIPTAGPHDA